MPLTQTHATQRRTFQSLFQLILFLLLLNWYLMSLHLSSKCFSKNRRANKRTFKRSGLKTDLCCQNDSNQFHLPGHGNWFSTISIVLSLKMLSLMIDKINVIIRPKKVNSIHFLRGKPNKTQWKPLQRLGLHWMSVDNPYFNSQSARMHKERSGSKQQQKQRQQLRITSGIFAQLGHSVMVWNMLFLTTLTDVYVQCFGSEENSIRFFVESKSLCYAIRLSKHFEFWLAPTERRMSEDKWEFP